jgi:hypothetical protein
LEKAILLTITRQGYVGLAPEDSFYQRIQAILRDNADLITDTRCKLTYDTFQYQYDKMGIKDFVAPLDEKHNLPHRIRILFEYEDDDEMEQYYGTGEKREVCPYEIIAKTYEAEFEHIAKSKVLGLVSGVIHRSWN